MSELSSNPDLHAQLLGDRLSDGPQLEFERSPFPLEVDQDIYVNYPDGKQIVLDVVRPSDGGRVQVMANRAGARIGLELSFETETVARVVVPAHAEEPLRDLGF